MEELERELFQNKNKYGRNNRKKEAWSGNDVSNMDNLNKWLRRIAFPEFKFLPRNWWVFAPKEYCSICYKVLAIVKIPRDIKMEWYWENRLVPIINKKYVEMRSNINGACCKEYQGKFSLNYLFAV